MIDLCFTDLKHIESSGVLKSSFSDHLPTFILRKKQREQHTGRTFTGRSDRNFLSEEIGRRLANKTVEDGSDPNLMWDSLEKTYTRIADSVCPLKTFEIKSDRPERRNQSRYHD